jgi:hypothetical protein
MNIRKINHWGDIPENYTGIVDFPLGTRQYHLNGKIHRENGPAIELYTGDKIWYLNGKLHRIDGPAIDFFVGRKEWWLEGIKYSQEEWFEKLSEEDKEKAIWNLG